MIVGGGDLSIADEALKHKTVKEVVLVDIDDRVIELCREHFAEINAKAFKDKRLKIEVADAFEYLGRAKSKGRFDLIVADRPDPVGPGKALFGETFYDRVKAGLAPGGFATFQTGVPFYQPWEITDALKELADPARRVEMAAACRRWASQFDWDTCAAQTAALISALLRGQTPATGGKPGSA